MHSGLDPLNYPRTFRQLARKSFKPIDRAAKLLQIVGDLWAIWPFCPFDLLFFIEQFDLLFIEFLILAWKIWPLIHSTFCPSTDNSTFSPSTNISIFYPPSTFRPCNHFVISSFVILHGLIHELFLCRIFFFFSALTAGNVYIKWTSGEH